MVFIGYPAPILRGCPVAEPHHLGRGWVGFDLEKAFQGPVRLVNDAAMQTLGSYEGGEMLLLGLGTGLGSTPIIDGTAEPMELGPPSLPEGIYEEYVGARGLAKYCPRKWQRSVADVVACRSARLEPDYLFLGGGNAKELKPLVSW